MKKAILAGLMLCMLLGGCDLFDSASDPEESDGPTDTAASSTTSTTLLAESTTLAATTTTAGATTTRRPATTRPAGAATTARPAATTTKPPTTTTSRPLTGKPITLGQPFTLALGEVAAYQAGNLSVLFAELDDSRCPPNVQCVQAGNGRVRIRVTQGGATSLLVLNTNTVEGPKTAFFNNYSFEMTSLTPASSAPTSEYRATLVVRAF